LARSTVYSAGERAKNGQEAPVSHPAGCLVGMDADRALSSVASAQRALITHRQARDAGLSEDAIRHRIDSGRWERVHIGVYGIAGAPHSWHRDLAAACLATGAGAVVSHRSAAALWELDGIAPDVVEITVARPLCHRLRGVVVHRSSDIHTSVTAMRSGLPVTDPMRTLVDLGAVVHRRVVERALDHALSRRLATPVSLGRELEAVARRGRRGAGVLRLLLEARSGGGAVPDSVLEARLLRLCRDHALPVPVCQHEVRVGRRLLGRVDFAFPERRLAVEVDGYEHHSSLAAFQRDRVRQNDLVAAGWTVLRFTCDDIRRRPERVVTSILTVLGALDGAEHQ
jgi:very-short-patch-repair endonuclease